MDEGFVDKTEVVIALVREDGDYEILGETSGFRVSPDCEYVDAVTTSVRNAVDHAMRAMQRRDGVWRALLATLPCIHVNTLGDTFSPVSDEDWSYQTEFPIRIYLQKVD